MNFAGARSGSATSAAPSTRLPPPPSLPEWFTPYSLRHTCASLMAQQGVPVTTAAAILGHDPAMFLRVYSHLYPDDPRGAAAVLDAARTTEMATARSAEIVQALRAENHSTSNAVT